MVMQMDVFGDRFINDVHEFLSKCVVRGASNFDKVRITNLCGCRRNSSQSYQTLRQQKLHTFG